MPLHNQGKSTISNEAAHSQKTEVNLHFCLYLSVRVQGPDQGGEGEGEEEGAGADLQECSPHLPRLPPPLRRL